MTLKYLTSTLTLTIQSCNKKSYFCFIQLVLSPNWDGAEDIDIPIEIKIGNKDSQTRFTRSLSDTAMTDTTENMERWDVPPCIEDGKGCNKKTFQHYKR